MESFSQFIDLIRKLRSPQGCPWDKEQTFDSLKPHIIEEAYEVVDAIQNKSFSNLKEELGDVLLHVVMLSNMASEENQFSISDVISDISEKMIRRHPHVFGNVEAKTVDEVWDNWDKIKRQEKENGLFDSIPHSLPALMQAQKIQKKAARLGFDWVDLQGPLDKVKEETHELETALISSDLKSISEELGDLLFSVVNLSRKLKIDPEEALKNTSKKFITRFNWIEAELKRDNLSWSECNLEQLEMYWQKSKKN